MWGIRVCAAHGKKGRIWGVDEKEGFSPVLKCKIGRLPLSNFHKQRRETKAWLLIARFCGESDGGRGFGEKKGQEKRLSQS